MWHQQLAAMCHQQLGMWHQQLAATWHQLGGPAAMLHASTYHTFWTIRHVNLSCSDGSTDIPSDCKIQANFIQYFPGKKYALWSGNYGT